MERKCKIYFFISKKIFDVLMQGGTCVRDGSVYPFLGFLRQQAILKKIAANSPPPDPGRFRDREERPNKKHSISSTHILIQLYLVKFAA